MNKTMPNNTMRRELWALLSLTSALALGACGDSVSSGGKKPDAACEGFGGCGEVPDAGGGSGGTGGGGGEPEPGRSCLEDDACDPSQYCLFTGDDPEGVCTAGCRDDAACGDGNRCEPSTRECLCTSDAACGADEYCDTGDGACKPGCRPDAADACPDGQTCNPETRECEGGAPGQAVCCSADGASCTLAADAAACDGTFVARLTSCEPNPCGPACDEDADCAADRYCSADGTCLTGCREGDASACPDGSSCDPEKHTCEPDEEVPCDPQDPDACPDGQFCDPNTGMCLDGCGGDADCPPGQHCDDQNMCVPNDGCTMDNECGQGEYCDPAFGCRDFCADNGQCQPDEFCDLGDPAGGRCVAGCRDDDQDGTNNTPETATDIVLVNNHGEVAGALVCPDNPDFYAVELFQQARMQVTLTAVDPAIGDIQLRIYEPDGQTVAVEAVQPGSPKRLRFPAMGGQGAPRPDTYFIEVVSSDPVSQAYNLSVTLIDVAVDGACFPDDGEFDNEGRGHNAAVTAVELPWDGAADETFTFRGSICGGDEDWFRFESPDDNMGVSIELNVEGLSGDAVVELYNDVTVRNLGNPSFTSGPGVGAGGTVSYRLDVPRDQAQLGTGRWYVRLRGADAASLLDDYGLNIQLLRPRAGCEDDGAEPNGAPGAVTDAADLDVLTGGLPRNQDVEIPVAVRLCPREEDWYRFEAEDGDQISAWVTSPSLAGQAIIEIAGADGNVRGMAGAMTADGQPTQAATYNGARPGTHYLRVRSVAAGSADPYTIVVHINPTAMCGADVAEVGPQAMRNDTFEDAVLLMSQDANAERYEYVSGLICDFDGPDLDWYKVTVPANEPRGCIEAAFQPSDGDLQLEVFEGVNDPNDDRACNRNADCTANDIRASRRCLANENVCGCLDDDDCDIDGDGLDREDGRCVNSRCKVALADSRTDGVEFLSFEPGTLSEGDKWILVSGQNGGENAYSLNVTLHGARPECAPDWREIEQANDDPAQAVFLGTGQSGVCDAWVCNDERGIGDWYSFDIPPGTGNRTVLVTYDEFNDGRAALLFQVEDAAGMATFYERPAEIAADPREDCANIDVGANGGRVYVSVIGRRENLVDEDAETNYTLRILPYDPAADPDGRCEDFVPNPTAVWDFAIP